MDLRHRRGRSGGADRVFQRHARPPGREHRPPGREHRGAGAGRRGVDPDGDRKPGPHVKPAIEDQRDGVGGPTEHVAYDHRRQLATAVDRGIALLPASRDAAHRRLGHAAGSHVVVLVARAPRRIGQLLERDVHQDAADAERLCATYPCRAVLPDDGCSSRAASTTAPRSTRPNQRGRDLRPGGQFLADLARRRATRRTARIGIGDQSCVVMPNGQMLLAAADTAMSSSWIPARCKWTALHPAGKLGGNDSSEEENWTPADRRHDLHRRRQPPRHRRALPPAVARPFRRRPVGLGRHHAGAADRRRVVRDRTPGPASRRHRARHRGHRRQTRSYHPPATLYGTGTWSEAAPFTDSAATSKASTTATASVLPNGEHHRVRQPRVYQRPTTEFQHYRLGRTPAGSAAASRGELVDQLSYSVDSMLLPSGQMLATLIGGGEEPLVPAYVYTPATAPRIRPWAPAVNADALRRLHVGAGQTVTLTGTQFQRPHARQ